MEDERFGNSSWCKQDVLLGLLALFVPPVPVIIRKGFFSRDFLLNFLLTGVFYFPAILHAIYVIYETSPVREADYIAVETSGGGGGGVVLGSRSDMPDLEAQPVVPPNYDEVVQYNVATYPADNKVQHP